jgi:hypothetical protein
MTFQTTVNLDPAIGIEGDFPSANPRASMLAGEGQLRAGPNGVTIGRFAWANLTTGLVNNGAFAGASRIGFVHKTQIALIGPYLGGSTMLVPPGYEITLHDAGDFLVRFAAGATVGQKVFASYADGSAVGAATGSPTTNAGITANTTSGSPTLTVTANSGAPVVVGQPVSGTGIPAGTTITALGTGTGGAGTYTMSANATATGTGVTVTASTNFETRWYVDSPAGAGELAMISTRG